MVEIVEVVHKVVVTLLVRETDMVGVKVEEVQTDTVTVEHVLGVFVAVIEPV